MFTLLYVYHRHHPASTIFFDIGPRTLTAALFRCLLYVPPPLARLFIT